MTTAIYTVEVRLEFLEEDDHEVDLYFYYVEAYSARGAIAVIAKRVVEEQGLSEDEYDLVELEFWVCEVPKPTGEPGKIVSPNALMRRGLVVEFVS